MTTIRIGKVKGEDAKINGQNILTITGGSTVNVNTSGSTMELSGK